MRERHMRILEAAMDRVLPSSEAAPGATAAGALQHVERLLESDVVGPDAATIGQGLELLDSAALSRWGRPFPECRSTEQDAVLRQVQDIPHPPVQQFFSLLVRLTLSGFLCAPEHGGNRSGMGWRFVGFMPRSP